MNILILFTLNFCMFSVQIVVGDVSDYCLLGCADPRKTHAVCVNKKKKFIDHCPPDTRIIRLDHLKSIIVDLHNEERQFVASGDAIRYQPAERMGEMSWDQELADLAEYSVRRCLVDDPYCYTTPTMKAPGRSARIFEFKKIGKISYENLIPLRIENWLETTQHCTLKIAASFPEKPLRGVELFGRAIIDSNNRIGCAASEWVKNSKQYSLLVCLYPKDVQPGYRLYKAGNTAASCLDGYSEKYPNLCSVKENYNRTQIKPRRLIQIRLTTKKPRKKFLTPEGSLWQLIM